MKVFAVVGYTKSGKTTTIEKIIAELRKRGYTVGSVKDIHYEAFHIDSEGTNTDRHKKAGSQLVTARGLYETDILFQRPLDLYEIAKFYDTDYLILEGYRDGNVPMILTADCMKDLDERYDGRAFLVSGKIADSIDHYHSLKALSALEHTEEICDIIETTVFDLLPDFDVDCCSSCGMSCRELCTAIIRGDRKRTDCVIDDSIIELTIDGVKIPMVPFVQRILHNAVVGVVSELEGYQKGSAIKLSIGGELKRENP
ncbi:MAG: molybdopterin-guanine dinucleotide biosynthesis adapter protein [Clostridiales bacterium]|jgi:molybdopterin-guanine dinucleotide biosynthesis protein B|nr:molybdopterin-guanine dinucleotide biosynthesis adapter protein [Clostridiales bacterium]MDN5298915.1 molybdopterin-guanine dinucleotide biosynthesis adapter protein [Clostridiales bacterium]